MHLRQILALAPRSLGCTNRMQAADTLGSVATVLGPSYPAPQLTANVDLMMGATTVRTTPGKSANAMLSALAKFLTLRSGSTTTGSTDVVRVFQGSKD